MNNNENVKSPRSTQANIYKSVTVFWISFHSLDPTDVRSINILLSETDFVLLIVALVSWFKFFPDVQNYTAPYSSSTYTSLIFYI